MRSNELVLNVKEITCRIETDPGDVMQVDYFKAGLLYDPAEGRMRMIYGFIATLSYSLHKFIEFVFRQNQPRKGVLRTKLRILPCQSV